MPSSRGSSNPGVEPESLMSPALAGGFFTPRKPQSGLRNPPSQIEIEQRQQGLWGREMIEVRKEMEKGDWIFQSLLGQAQGQE